MDNNNFSIIDRILKVVTYLLLLLLFVAFISPYFSYEYVNIIPLVGLISPIIIFLSLIVTGYWILKWNKIAILCVIMIILGIGQISKFVQVPVNKDVRPKGSILKLLTFNTCNFSTREHKDYLKESIECIDSINAQIICFQELPTSNKKKMDILNKGLKKYPYKHISEDKSKLTAIYSKFKIVNKGILNFEGTANNSIYVDILYRNDTIRVFNNHLESTKITTPDIKFLSDNKTQIASKDGVFKLFTIIKKLISSNKLRGKQTNAIREEMDKVPYSTIVCGDHNVTPLSYTYNIIRGDMKDSFMEKGSWYGYTYRNFAKLLRIDFVFHSKKFETVSYSSPNLMKSDHKPVIVELKYNK